MTSKAAKGGQSGNDNARSRRTGASPAAPPVPVWLSDARQAMTRAWPAFQRRNWGGDAKTPNLYGMTVTVPDPKRERIPNTARPFRAMINGEVFWVSSPAEARSMIEAEFVRREDAKRAVRLAANPFDDPLRRAALYRAMRGA